MMIYSKKTAKTSSTMTTQSSSKNNKNSGNKLKGFITQVDQGSTQPKQVQKDEIPGDFFVEEQIVIGHQRKSDVGK